MNVFRGEVLNYIFTTYFAFVLKKLLKCEKKEILKGGRRDRKSVV